MMVSTLLKINQVSNVSPVGIMQIEVTTSQKLKYTELQDNIVVAHVGIIFSW